jgi:hypothetical protein
MLIRTRGRDNKYQKRQMIEPEGIVAAAYADSSACYNGQKPVFLIFYESI